MASVVGLALQLPAHAKPINGCLVQEADLLDPTLCLSPPERLASTRPASQTPVDAAPNKVARVTLDNIDSGSGSNSGSSSDSNIDQFDVGNCSALRGTHEAQNLMLQNIQAQLQRVTRDRRAAKARLKSLRRSGADEGQLSSAASRVSTYNAVWGALQADVEKRTKGFNNSMSRLTKACLRG